MDRDLRADDRVVRLLGALVALTAVLLLGVAAGGVLLWREYRGLRGAVEAVAGGGGASAREVAAEIASRQQQASQELASATRDAARQIARFERRADVLRGKGGGPAATASRAVEMTQLMTDEMILQLKLMAALNGVIEKTIRPLEPERALLQAGDGDVGRGPERRGRTPARR